MKTLIFLILFFVTGSVLAAEGMQKLVNYWAGSVCELTTPGGWEDGDGEGPDEHAQKYGYANEAEVVASVKQHIASPSFRTELRRAIDQQCPGNVDGETFENMVNGLEKQYKQQ